MAAGRLWFSTSVDLMVAQADQQKRPTKVHCSHGSVRAGQVVRVPAGPSTVIHQGPLTLDNLTSLDPNVTMVHHRYHISQQPLGTTL